MMTISVKEARSQLKQLLDRVAAGEEITIQRHGKNIAKLVPPSPSKKHLPSLKAFRSSIQMNGTSLSSTVIRCRQIERY